MLTEQILYIAVIVALILVLAHFSNSTDDIYKQYLYFDYNGTTPPHRAVIKQMTESAWMGNASGVYAKKAKESVERARDAVAWWLASPSESSADGQAFRARYHIIFNSGASEGNNHVIRSLTEGSPERPHVVMSSVEHKTSIDCIKRMCELQLADVTFVDPASDGRMDPADIGSAMNDRTVLVSIMHYNNETGSINDIASIGKAVKTIASLQDRYIAFHVDAVQSFGKVPIPMTDLGIDALTMSFHKIYGTSGLGCLVLNKNLTVHAQIAGTQNDKLRGGTENTASIATIPITMQITMHNRYVKNARLQAYKNYIVQALTQTFVLGDYAQYYGKSDNYDPHTTSSGAIAMVFLGPTVDGMPDARTSAPNTLYLAVVKHAPLSQHFCNIVLRDSLFRDHRVVVSIGSACSAGTGGASHVLNAIKAPYIIRCGVIRISFGDYTTWTQVRALCKALISCIRAQ
jgi:cysteine desulfurase